MKEERMMRWFETKDVDISGEAQKKIEEACGFFGDLATWVSKEIPNGPERTVTFRKLLEARDASVRSVVEGQDRPGDS